MLPDRSSAVLVVSAVFLGIATVFTVLRCISKFGIRRRSDPDDFVALLAWLFTAAVSITIIIGATYGLGKEDDLIPPANELPLKRSIYAFTILYNPSLMATKTAILILYIRMASAHPFLRYASFALLAVVDIAGLVLTLISIFQCQPITAAFNDQDGKCIDIVTLFLASAPINILTDLAILLLPLPILTSLRIEIRAKVGLVLTFICGGFVTIVDVIRIAYLQTALKQELGLGGSAVTATSRPPDFYYYVSYSLMWSAIECTVGLTCCCALVLKPLIQKAKPSSLLHRSSNNNNNQAGKHTPSVGADLTFPEIFSSSGPEYGPPLNAIPGALGPGVGVGVGPGPGVKQHRNSLADIVPGSKTRAPTMNVAAMPLQAILETDPDVDDEDTMDIFQFFAAGPPEPSAGAGVGVGTVAGTGVPLNNSSPIMNGTIGLFTSEPPSDLSLFSDPPRSPSLQPMVSPPRPDRRESRLSHLRRLTLDSLHVAHPRSEPPPSPTQQPTQNFFDFVQMGGRKPLTELTNREAWWPVLFVSSLFFLWGFAYGLIGTLNAQIITIIPTSPGKALALQNAYWMGYIVGPATFGYIVLPRAGFKATFITGLAIYACGSMAFWPSSVLASYAGFFISNFLIACGLSLLEVAANPFIALAGPGEYSEARLNFSQGFQGVGAVLSPILASKVLFRNVDGRITLFDVQWCYLAVALFVVFLALIFFYVPLAEASDDELEEASQKRFTNAHLDPNTRTFGLPTRQLLLWAGVFTMFLYVGAQESINYFWTPLMAEIKPGSDAFWNLCIGRSMFSFSRFLAAGMCYIGIPARLVLAGFLLGTVITSILMVVVPAGEGALVTVWLTMFFEAPTFPTLFPIILRGQGRHTKFASVMTTMAIGGVVVWQSVTYGANLATGGDVRLAMTVVVALFATQSVYAVGLSTRSTFRRWIDGRWSRTRTWTRTRAELQQRVSVSSSVEKKPSHMEHYQPPPQPPQQVLRQDTAEDREGGQDDMAEDRQDRREEEEERGDMGLGIQGVTLSV